MRNTTPLDYQELRNISPKAARQAILQILKSNNGKISETARMLGVTRKTVYKALAKRECGNLDDSSRSPKVVHNKTPNEIEEKVILLKRKTHYGPIRLKEELEAVYALQISAHTIRNIVRRNREKIKGKTHKPHKKGPRPFVDWYTARPFEVVQIDLKHVIDQKALTMAQIDHIHAHKLPIYQWSAIDVNSRFKLIAYSDEKSWTNGLTWFLWVTSWLRSHGVTHQIVYTVDHGEEFGGKSWYKITELRKLLSGFGCKLIQNHLKHPEENAHLERSHRTDDDEFYIPRILKINSRQEMFTEAFNYMFYYNAVRKHSGINRETPVQRLFRLEPHLDDRIKFVPPLILDNISINLGPWSGYHVLAQHHDQDEIRTSKGFYLGVILDLIVDALVIGMGMAIGIRNGLILSIGIVLQMIPLVFVMIAKARVQQLSLNARRQLALAVPICVFAGIILGFTLLQNQPEVVLHILMAGASGFLITAVTQSMIPAAYSGRSKPSLAPFFFLIGLTLYAALKFTGS